MKLKKAKRLNSKVKMALQGTSGTGKTFSSLLIAYGLCNDWSKVAVIDTENQSANLYAHLGEYLTISLRPPYTPEQYVEAIELCEQENIDVVIVDSLSHEWDCLLDYHSNLTGNSFANWTKVTPRHNQLITAILQSPLHIICTLRTKQEYVLNEKNGKQVPEKVGMKAVQREGLEYEFTIVFELSINQKATVSKDRTSLFVAQPDITLTPETGKRIADWCNSGLAASLQDIEDLISNVASIPELLKLFNTYPEFQEVLKPSFEKQKRLIKQYQLTPAQNEPSN